MTWSLSVNQLTAKDMQHCLQHFDDKWTLTRDHPTCKLLGASEIVTTRTLKSHYLYTGFIFKSTLTASSMGQGEDFSMIFFFLKKVTMITLSANIQPKSLPKSRQLGPTALRSSTRTVLGCEKIKHAKKGQAIIINSHWSRLTRVPPRLCTAGEHRWERSFGNRTRESHKYAYKYDVGQGTRLNILYGLRCHLVRKHKQTAKSRLLSLRNLRLANGWSLL